jgi:diguanylate cyclase (GGDEF)-like protein/PAS domain S-box-containing protein
MDPMEPAREDLRAILDGIPALVAYWDRDLRNRIANRAYLDVFGVAPGRIHGMHIRDVLGPQLYAQNLPYIRRVLAGEPQLFDREIPDRGGAQRYTQTSYIPDQAAGQVRGFFVLITDISARRQAEQRLEVAERRFRTLFDAAPIGSFLVSVDSVVTDVNPAAVELLGRGREELIGMEPVQFTHPDDRESSLAMFHRLVSGEFDHYRIEKRYLHKDGHTIWAQLDARLLRTEDDQAQVLGQLQDIAHRHREREQLQRLATQDPLTGLLNRRGLVAALGEVGERIERFGEAASLLLLDLDDFKRVNDTRGHQAGDRVMIEIAEVLRGALRASDVAARYGGDEFAVILPSAPVEAAEAIGEGLRDAIAEARLGSPEKPITASVGVTGIRPGDSAEGVVARADEAMYRAKRLRGGKPGRWLFSV